MTIRSVPGPEVARQLAGYRLRPMLRCGSADREACVKDAAESWPPITLTDETGQKPKVAQADSLYPAGCREACGPV